MSTPAQSKIEFTAHLIKISSQITVYIWELAIAGSLLIYLYMFMYAAVAPGTVCPGAIYNAPTIYSPTNNVVFIQFVTKPLYHL